MALIAIPLASPVIAEQSSCQVGKTKFEGQEACAIVQKMKAGVEVPFKPFEVMGLVNDICLALEGTMDERLKNDTRKTHFKTEDGFDCYQKGEPIWEPPVSTTMRKPLIVDSPKRRP